jgi:hypothetical protein
MLATALLAAAIATSTPSSTASPKIPAALRAASARAVAALVRSHGEAERARAERGVRQAASFWRPADGDATAFEAFCAEQFAPRGPALDAVFGRFEASFETLEGHLLEVRRDLSRFAHVDVGPMIPLDGLLAAHEPAAHLVDDLFDGKVAFVALLNFPLTTLEERLRDGERWSRREWAEARLANRFARRVPADVNQAIAKAGADADRYVADYNLFVHHLLSPSGERLFPKGKRLLSHWNLRDELKAQYAAQDGLPRQRALAAAMERIVTQTIPAAVVDDPSVDWEPTTNAVSPAPPETIEGGRAPRTQVSGVREPDRRYARILANFRAARAADPYSPSAPTLVARVFDLDREIPEARAVALLEAVLGAPEIPRVARLVAARLGRPLEPFDVWYSGFRPRAAHAEADLDRLTRERYPDAAAFARALPATLEALGFSPERARFLAERIAVDPARGSGHAYEAARRGDRSRLRTRIGPDGMDYKGFNIAIHELGHNVEQTFSLYGVDSTLLRGVPNTAFTEAIAFVFQARDLEVLGLPAPSAEARRLLALDRLWSTWEIAGVALVDLEVWRWLYAHPRATSAELREATLGIARRVWNRWYAPVLGARDVPLLAIYSHMVNRTLYLPDYPLGHLVAAQLERHLERLPPGTSLGQEIERVSVQGQLSPDLWMRGATGEPLSAEPLLEAAREGLEAVELTGRR